MNEALKINSLYAGYGNALVLKGVDLVVKDKETVCLLGANGAGKTTLLRTISGLIKPRSGEISFYGNSLIDKSPEEVSRLGISHVPEGRQIFTGLTVKQNLLLGTYARNMNRQEVEEIFEYCMELFPTLRDKLNQKAGTLSGGQQQMLAIARGLMSKPKLLLLDEPSLGLAPLVVDAIGEAIKSLKQKGISILMVEQNLSLCLSTADRIYVVCNGEITLERDVKNILENEELIKSYLGV